MIKKIIVFSVLLCCIIKSEVVPVNKPSPSINYLFHAGFHRSVERLIKINTEQELENNLLGIRQCYLICYAYWYASRVEKVKILDKNVETLLSLTFFKLENLKFDMRKDLSLIRMDENQKHFSKVELTSLHGASGFPCSRSHFLSDEKYEKLADEFVAWSKTLTKERKNEDRQNMEK